MLARHLEQQAGAVRRARWHRSMEPTASFLCQVLFWATLRASVRAQIVSSQKGALCELVLISCTKLGGSASPPPSVQPHLLPCLLWKTAESRAVCRYIKSCC